MLYNTKSEWRVVDLWYSWQHCDLLLQTNAKELEVQIIVREVNILS